MTYSATIKLIFISFLLVGCIPCNNQTITFPAHKMTMEFENSSLAYEVCIAAIAYVRIQDKEPERFDVQNAKDICLLQIKISDKVLWTNNNPSSDLLCQPFLIHVIFFIQY